MKTIKDFLASNPFFDGMSDDYLQTMAGCGKLVHFKQGEFLFKEGDDANHFYLIRDGHIAIETHVPAFGAVSITRVGPDDVLGYSWLFPPHRYSFDGHALSDVAAVCLDGKCLRGKAEADHEMGYQLMQRFARLMLDRLQNTRRQMLDVYCTGRKSDVGSGCS